MKQLLKKSIKAIFLALLFGAVVASAQQFQMPSGTPATMNAPLPINISANDQMKQGGLGISKLLIGPGSLTNVDPASASIMGNLRIGTGAIPTGAGVLQVNNKGGVGSNININMVPADGFSVYGLISNGGGIFSAKHLYAGNNAFLNTPTAAGTNGAVIADKFCFSGTTGTCISGTWPTGGASLTGLINQTVRFSATNTPVAAANLTNDGTSVTLNAVGAALTINGGTTALPNLLYLNAPQTAAKVAVIVNKQDLQFWNAVGNRNATIYGYDFVASNLANASTSHVCADANGKLVLCGPGGPTGGSPAIDLQVNGQDNYSTTIPDSFTISDAPNLTWSVTSLGAGWTCTGSNGWSGTKSANGGSQTIAINAYGTQTFVITCVNGAQTVSDTATYTANGYYTYYADGMFNPGAHSSIAGLTLTATAIGAGGGGAIFDLNPGYSPACNMTFSSAAIGSYSAGYPFDVAGRNATRSVIYNNNTAVIYASGSGGGGRPANANGPVSTVASSGSPTDLSTTSIDPNVIMTDSNGLVRGRGGEGTINDFNGGSVSCTANLLNGTSGGVGRGPIPNNNVNYTVDIGTKNANSNGNDGAIRISW